jgi:hypothetical protein
MLCISGSAMYLMRDVRQRYFDGMLCDGLADACQRVSRVQVVDQGSGEQDEK